MTDERATEQQPFAICDRCNEKASIVNRTDRGSWALCTSCQANALAFLLPYLPDGWIESYAKKDDRFLAMEPFK